MADRIHESAVRVVFDPDGIGLILVDWGSDLVDRVTLDGGQIVQVVPGVRAPGVNTYPRGNERHVLEFTRQFTEADLELAFQKRLARGLQLPRTKSAVLIWFETTGTQYRLENATIESWPSRQDGIFTEETVRILGGRYAVDAGTYTPTLQWA